MRFQVVDNDGEEIAAFDSLEEAKGYAQEWGPDQGLPNAYVVVDTETHAIYWTQERGIWEMEPGF